MGSWRQSASGAITKQAYAWQQPHKKKHKLVNLSLAPQVVYRGLNSYNGLRFIYRSKSEKKKDGSI